MRHYLLPLILVLGAWVQFLWYTEQVTTVANLSLSTFGLLIAYLVLDVEFLIQSLVKELNGEPEWTEDDVV